MTNRSNGEAMSTEQFLREVVFKKRNEQEARREKQCNAIGDVAMSTEDYLKYVVYGEAMPEHKKREYGVPSEEQRDRGAYRSSGVQSRAEYGTQPASGMTGLGNGLGNGHGREQAREVNPQGDTVLEYNGMGKLARKVENAQTAPVCWEYGYDAAGRLAVVMCQGQPFERYIYNDKGQRVLERCEWRGTERHFTYSPLGELIQAGSTRYFYAGDGSLAVKDEAGIRTEYFYGDDSRLDSVRLPDGTVISYQYGQSLGPVAKFCNGELVGEYEWRTPTQLARYMDHARGVQYAFAYGEAHSPVAVQIATSSGCETYGIECDQVGSVKRVWAANGSLIKDIAYDSFGNILKDSNPQFVLPVGFAGGLYDEHTGFVRFGYRDYDPCVGRFTAKDPARDLRGDGDLWDYCVDDPVNAKDNTGLLWNFAVQGAVGGVVSAGLNYPDYRDGNISGWDYAKKIAIGAGSSMVGAGVGSLAAKGAVKAATHFFGNTGKALSFMGGSTGGAVAGAGAEAAQQMMDNGKITDSAKVLQGGAVGMAAGGIGTKVSALKQAHQNGAGEAAIEMSKRATTVGAVASEFAGAAINGGVQTAKKK